MHTKWWQREKKWLLNARKSTRDEVKPTWLHKNSNIVHSRACADQPDTHGSNGSIYRKYDKQRQCIQTCFRLIYFKCNDFVEIHSVHPVFSSSIFIVMNFVGITCDVCSTMKRTLKIIVANHVLYTIFWHETLEFLAKTTNCT